MKIGSLVYDKILDELCIVVEVRPAMVVLLRASSGSVYPVQESRFDELEVIDGRES
jgi:hypothetical protein